MPWCPTCKHEYVNTVTHCSTCNCQLVENLTDDKKIILIVGEAEMVTGCLKFLEYNEITSGSMEYNADEENYSLFVSEEDERKATKILTIYLQEEEKRLAEEKENTEETNENSEDNQAEPLPYTGVYQNSSAKASEYKSSAYMLVIMGILGLIAMGFGYFDLLPFHLSTISYIVMSALFLFFIIFGIQSFGSSKRLQEKGKKEEILHSEVDLWARENFTKDYIDSLITSSKDDVEEILYFKRIEKMRTIITETFPSVNPAYTEELIDTLYPEIF